MDASETSKVYISISDHVISKTRSELVSNGKLKLSLLNEIHANWQRKMIQAGVISGTFEVSSGSKPVTADQDPNPLPPGYAETGIDIDAKVPSMDLDTDALFPSTELEMFNKNEQKGSYIPQKDGSGDGDDADIKPKTYDEDDVELNENDDLEEEEGGIDDDHIKHLILCQFDHVKKKKNKWDCKLKSGVMYINGKDILFSQAKGDFDF